ncbi:UNVERIFIED_CONTAM: hypothetical protein Sradi_4646400 [Sesamum radiatum]|uniref:WIYLD domain-containing protein n=1 Tax=Sesamum radiatum TaxID=300843 RepID=A0AAW2NCU9_SESRA
MHAALDAMRPMGFSTDTVRKCVKNLLKVYGDDGWLFIEEAAYKLLIDTILEEPEVPQLDHAPEHSLLEGGKHGSDEHSESLHELCDKEVISEKQVSVTDVHVAEAHDEDIDIGLEKSQEQDLDVKLTPMLLQYGDYSALPCLLWLKNVSFMDVLARHKVGLQSGHALVRSPQPTDGIQFSCRCKPCYGWISDDDENNEFSAVEPS